MKRYKIRLSERFYDSPREREIECGGAEVTPSGALILYNGTYWLGFNQTDSPPSLVGMKLVKAYAQGMWIDIALIDEPDEPPLTAKIVS